MLKLNLKPEINIIEECFEDNWQEREKYWIKYCKEKGFKLTNSTEGGEGIIDKTGEIGRRISESRKGMKFTDEHKLNLSKSHIGFKPSL